MADEVEKPMTDEEAIQNVTQMQAERRNWERQNMSLRQLERMLDAARNAKKRLNDMKDETTRAEKRLADLDIEFNNAKTQNRKAIEKAKQDSLIEIAEINGKTAKIREEHQKLQDNFLKLQNETNEKIKKMNQERTEAESKLDKATKNLEAFKMEHKL